MAAGGSDSAEEDIGKTNKRSQITDKTMSKVYIVATEVVKGVAYTSVAISIAR
jgi:hypothetical protein